MPRRLRLPAANPARWSRPIRSCPKADRPRRAARRGLAPAQYRLGSLYEKGQGVKKDPIEARRLYLAAAQQGNAKAMHNLAVLYAVGIESGPEYKAASEWFHRAAKYGVADSQY